MCDGWDRVTVQGVRYRIGRDGNRVEVQCGSSGVWRHWGWFDGWFEAVRAIDAAQSRSVE